MTDKIKSLLAVLDMPEKSAQRDEWVYGKLPELLGWREDEWKNCCLADLAFRLRDEVFERKDGGNELAGGYKIVIKKLKPNALKLGCAVDWWACCATPIDWIIASLIAKELAKENNG